jgi:hypothetical protein
MKWMNNALVLKKTHMTNISWPLHIFVCLITLQHVGDTTTTRDYGSMHVASTTKRRNPTAIRIHIHGLNQAALV